MKTLDQKRSMQKKKYSASIFTVAISVTGTLVLFAITIVAIDNSVNTTDYILSAIFIAISLCSLNYARTILTNKIIISEDGLQANKDFFKWSDIKEVNDNRQMQTNLFVNDVLGFGYKVIYKIMLKNDECVEITNHQVHNMKNLKKIFMKSL